MGEVTGVKKLPGVGVFGTSSMVKVLVPILRTNGFKVEAVWGRTQELAEQTAREHKIAFHTSNIDEVLLRKSVDFVCIICPPNLHSQIAVKALGIGKHVLCDRPAGLNQTDALKMVNGAQYYPSLISLMSHALRFLPSSLEMRQLIKSGYVGDVTVCEAHIHCGSQLEDTYSWVCDEMMGGGVLSVFGSHIIDLISFLTQQKVKKVDGMLKTFVAQTSKINGIRSISADDFCSLQMELEGGVCASVTINSHVPGSFSQQVIVCGTAGYLAIRNDDLFGQQYGKSNEEQVLFKDNEKSNYNMPPSLNVPRPYVRGLSQLIATLKVSFENGQNLPHAANFEDGLYIQAVLDAVRRSSKNRCWVKVDVVMEEHDANPYMQIGLSATIRKTLPNASKNS